MNYYNLTSLKWNTIKARDKHPAPVKFVACALYTKKTEDNIEHILYLHGGVDNSYVYSNLWKYIVETNTWEDITPVY